MPFNTVSKKQLKNPVKMLGQPIILYEKNLDFVHSGLITSVKNPVLDYHTFKVLIVTKSASNIQ
jgi:hypothetical protein